MPDADASDHSRFPGRFVQNVLQHHHVLALTGGRHHQSLSRLAQREGGIVLGGEVRRHHPVDVVAEGSRPGPDHVLGFGAIFRAAFPQRGDVFVGQIHIVADVHGPKNQLGGEQHRRKPISPLKGKQKEKAISVSEVNTMSKFPTAYSLTGDTCSQMSAMALQRADPVVHVH